MSQHLTIPLGNALATKTTFCFTITKDSLDISGLPHQDFEIKKIEILIEAQKFPNHYECTFCVKGSINVPCDLCVEEFPKNIWEEYFLIIKPAHNPEAMNKKESATDIYYVHQHLGSFNFKKLIFDYISLAVPNKKQCESVGKTNYCNKENLQKLKKHILN